MALDAALDQIHLLGETELTAAVQHQLAVTLHRTETALEQVAFGLGDLELLGEGVSVDRAAGLGQQLQDVLAAGQRRVVTLGLALVEGIGPADRRNRGFAGLFVGMFVDNLISAL
jgi:hypothetical protein